MQGQSQRRLWSVQHSQLERRQSLTWTSCEAWGHEAQQTSKYGVRLFVLYTPSCVPSPLLP